MSTNLENLEIDYKTDTWTVIRSYFAQPAGLVGHQIRSFEHFIEHAIQQIVDSSPDIVIKDNRRTVVIRLGQVYISKPVFVEQDGAMSYITPNQARTRNLPYSSNVYVNITRLIEEGEGDNSTVDESTDIVYIGSLPIMVNSKYCALYEVPQEQRLACGECPHDDGGYFIITGSEKVLVGQERMAFNEFFVFRKEPLYTVEVRSMSENQASALFKISLKSGVTENKDEIFANVVYINSNIPIMVLLKALGFEDTAEIYRLVAPDLDSEMIELLDKAVEDPIAKEIPDARSALTFIAKKMNNTNRKDLESKAVELLRRYLLPHLGTSEFSERRKGLYICLMLNNLLRTKLGKREEDDRDHIKNKRVEVSGALLNVRFKQVFKGFIHDLTNNLKRAVEHNKPLTDINIYIDNKRITNGIKLPFSTGNWGDIGSQRTGVSQVLSRMNYISSLSHLNRITTQSDRQSKLIKPRYLHGTQYSKYCVSETPEGQSVGFVKNLAFMTDISTETPIEPIMVLFEHLGVTPLELASPEELSNSARVLINGAWVGVHSSPEKLTSYLRTVRRQEQIPYTVSISFIRHENEVRVLTDEGRITRPLYIVDNNQTRINSKHIEGLLTGSLDWLDLVNDGIVEFLDALEEEDSLIAMDPSELRRGNEQTPPKHYTHQEIHPSMMLGVSASTVPFPDHNEAPRIVFQAAMGKQAVGIPLLSHAQRMNTMDNILDYPQKPLVSSQPSDIARTNQLPTGTNAIVAIMVHSGFNQEDSLIINQSAVDRGLFRSTFYKTYIETEKSLDSTIRIEKPDNQTRKSLGDYSKIESDGMVPPGRPVQGNDILIGKTKQASGDERKKDASIRLRDGEGGTVDRVVLTTNASGTKMIKVKLRNQRVPEIGDKLCLTPDHEVLTTDGWIPITDVTTRHKVSCYNPTLDRVECHYPSKIYNYNYSGEMYHIKTDDIDLITTLNHKMYVAKEQELMNSRTYDVAYRLVPAHELVGKRDVCYMRLDSEHNIARKAEKPHQRVLPVNNTSVKKESTEPYTGTVHCLEVPTHIFYVRRNGLPVWTGNSARHGQKGTIGMSFRQEDLPFTKEGIVPDLIMNPHAIPSRMTIGQLLECVSGKVGSLDGTLRDGTPFTDFSVDDLTAELEGLGYEKTGLETLYSGRTGEKMEAMIFIGPVYYQRLKHMVSNKLHSRGRGPIQMLTRQPLEGRARDGGLRFGKLSCRKKWNVKVLLVCVTAGYTIKFRETPKAFDTKLTWKLVSGFGENSKAVIIQKIRCN